MKKTAAIIVLLFILTIVSGCGDTDNSSRSALNFTETEFTDGSTEESSLNAMPTNAERDRIIYTNLYSEKAVNEVKELLAKANISEKRIDTVLEWAEDFNFAMKNCPAFNLVGDFTAVEGNFIDYGDYGLMSAEWYKNAEKDYDDILCRIAAYELNRENISVKTPLSEENFDCYDENDSWLYSDGTTIFGEQTSDGGKHFRPHPLIKWDESIIANYFTLFDPIKTEEGCTEEEMYEAVTNYWSGREISFGREKYSLITLWTQYNGKIAVSHAAALIETESGYLLFEKTNPQSPYSAAKFSSTDRVKQYLYDSLKSDYSKYGLETGTYIILSNDALL